MTQLNNLDEIDFPLIMSYDTKEGQVKYVRDIINSNISKRIEELQKHLVPKGGELTCPIFDEKIVCTDCNTAHYLKQMIGVDEDVAVQEKRR